jgi:hypothetical protein
MGTKFKAFQDGILTVNTGIDIMFLLFSGWWAYTLKVIIK